VRYLSALVTLPLVLWLASIAHAHALLDHASPRVGSTIATAPTEVVLWFTQKLEPAFSTAEVRDSNGACVDDARIQVDSSDATILHALKPLSSGSYRCVPAGSIRGHARPGPLSLQRPDSNRAEVG
jgi:methionine-rich copper-binding protein CopC